MAIVGLDIGRGYAVACQLDRFPSNPRRWFNQNRKQIIKLDCSHDGLNALLDMEPEGIVMEPTGRWYSAFWLKAAQHYSIPVRWVGHGDLAGQRVSYGFSNKRDAEDAFCLALTYYDDRFIDVCGRKRYLHFSTGAIERVRDIFFELEQLDKLETAMSNHIRQRLGLECPEIMERQAQASRAKNPLPYSPFWGYLAGRYSYPRIVADFEASVARRIGVDLSTYTSLHADALCELQSRSAELNSELMLTLNAPEFAPYLRVFERFGFGLRNKACLLSLCYPIDRFLLNGHPWIEREETESGKIQKRHRSLRSFQAFLGLTYKIKQSGDQLKKKFGGSDVCRAHLYMWCMDKIAVTGRRRLQGRIGQILGDKYDHLRKRNEEGKSSSDAVPGKDAIIRVLFRATSLLFCELCRELGVR